MKKEALEVFVETDAEHIYLGNGNYSKLKLHPDQIELVVEWLKEAASDVRTSMTRARVYAERAEYLDRKAKEQLEAATLEGPFLVPPATSPPESDPALVLSPRPPDF